MTVSATSVATLEQSIVAASTVSTAAQQSLATYATQKADTDAAYANISDLASKLSALGAAAGALASPQGFLALR